MSTNPYEHDQYTLRRKVFKIFGGAFHIFDEMGQLVLYSEQKAFKLREDIRLYSDETKAEELITISARSIIDFSAAYDVVDATTGERVGALRRKGLSSIFRDEWLILDVDEIELGRIREDSMFLALIRRYAMNLIPQKFHAEMNGQTVARYQQNFNPFVQKINIDFSEDTDYQLDRRLGLAAAVLLCAIEGRQQ